VTAAITYQRSHPMWSLPIFCASSISAFRAPETRHHLMRKHILPSGRLLINPFVKMNDPQENKAWVFNVES
jgi:hypothetical protein